MATDAGGAPDETADPAFADQPDAAGEEAEESHYFVEVWNDYDPSMRFVAIFPVGEDQGATASSVAYYILEPGKHTGLHSDNAEEVMFVTEGEGEVFVIGNTRKLEAGKFYVFPAGMEHDVYAAGSSDLRLLSFFPTPEAISTFQQAIMPVGGNDLSSKVPKPVVHELDPNNLPENFPFSLEDLGLAESEEAPQGLSTTQRLLGMTEPGVPPPPEVWENATVTPAQPEAGEQPAADPNADPAPAD